MKSTSHRIFRFTHQDRWYAYFPRTPDRGYIQGKAPFIHSERWLESAFDNFHHAMSCDIVKLLKVRHHSAIQHGATLETNRLSCLASSINLPSSPVAVLHLFHVLASLLFLRSPGYDLTLQATALISCQRTAQQPRICPTITFLYLFL